MHQRGGRPTDSVCHVRLSHQGFGHCKSTSTALLALAVILPVSAVDHRGVQVPVAGQRRLDDDTAGNLGGVPVLDCVLDELGNRVHDVGDVVRFGAELRQPFAKPGANRACCVDRRIHRHPQRRRRCASLRHKQRDVVVVAG